MQEQVIQFAKEQVVYLLILTGWYFAAGLTAALFAKRTRIDAWCEANPKLALALNLLRATGFDFWKTVATFQTLARSKAGLPPITALLFVGLLGFGQSGCAFLRSPTFWEGVNATCEIALTATPEVKAKSLATGTPAGDIATILCGIADVIEPFAREEVAKREGRRMAGEPAVRQAVAVAVEKGML